MPTTENFTFDLEFSELAKNMPANIMIIPKKIIKVPNFIRSGCVIAIMDLTYFLPPDLSFTQLLIFTQMHGIS